MIFTLSQSNLLPDNICDSLCTFKVPFVTELTAAAMATAPIMMITWVTFHANIDTRSRGGVLAVSRVFGGRLDSDRI